MKHGKQRQKRGNIKDTREAIPNRVHINESPSEIEQRKRIGDLEADLMMGKAINQYYQYLRIEQL